MSKRNKSNRTGTQNEERLIKYFIENTGLRFVKIPYSGSIDHVRQAYKAEDVGSISGFFPFMVETKALAKYKTLLGKKMTRRFGAKSAFEDIAMKAEQVSLIPTYFAKVPFKHHKKTYTVWDIYIPSYVEPIMYGRYQINPINRFDEPLKWSGQCNSGVLIYRSYDFAGALQDPRFFEVFCESELEELKFMKGKEIRYEFNHKLAYGYVNKQREYKLACKMNYAMFNTYDLEEYCPDIIAPEFSMSRQGYDSNVAYDNYDTVMSDSGELLVVLTERTVRHMTKGSFSRKLLKGQKLSDFYNL